VREHYLHFRICGQPPAGTDAKMNLEGRAAASRGRPLPTASVEVLHDDGHWYLAQLLGQHRDRATGEWRCGVRYTVDVGAQDQREGFSATTW
jgi:hypothetical protein